MRIEVTDEHIQEALALSTFDDYSPTDSCAVALALRENGIFVDNDVMMALGRHTEPETYEYVRQFTRAFDAYELAVGRFREQVPPRPAPIAFNTRRLAWY